MRAIAFYLPQFHPIPENDAWWGADFTEWTNVRKARPLFPGHDQPHVPADLGYYDLRDPGARQAQADLAQAHGIHGLCYYHYWFNGKRLLEKPFNDVLESGNPAFPFCLCWANHHWNRAWDGHATQLLMQQTYSAQDDLAHIRWLVTAFRDERYIRVDGKPLFLVYNASDLPDVQRTTAIWRDEARRLGIDGLFLVKVESFTDRRHLPTSLGFDAAIDFQPNTAVLLTPWEKIYWRIVKRFNWQHGVLVVDYAQFAQRALKMHPRPYTCFPSVTPGWDNSPRRASGAFILHDSTPERYAAWLGATLDALSSKTEPLVFINAWNEWAEGNHLEPCQKWGRAYLEATRHALQNHR